MLAAIISERQPAAAHCAPDRMHGCGRLGCSHAGVLGQRPDTNPLRSSSAITTDCSAASTSISKTSPALRSFVREVREARPELDAVVAELHSLEGVLDILKDDANSFPWDLAKRTPPLLKHCTSIINQIEGYMHVCNGVGLSKRDKKFRWLAIRGDMMKLRLTLEGYKAILALVTDLVGLYVSFLHGFCPLALFGRTLVGWRS